MSIYIITVYLLQYDGNQRLSISDFSATVCWCCNMQTIPITTLNNMLERLMNNEDIKTIDKTCGKKNTDNEKIVKHKKIIMEF